MSANRSPSSFKPSVEGLEDRRLLAAPAFYFLPENTPGHYVVRNQPFYVFAIDYTGQLNHGDSQAAWTAAERSAVKQNISLDLNVSVRDRTDANHHLLLGFWNKVTKRGGWIALDFASAYSLLVPTGGFFNPGTRSETHTKTNYIVNSGGVQTVTDQGMFTYTTSGSYHITFTFGGDSLGQQFAGRGQGDEVATWSKDF